MAASSSGSMGLAGRYAKALFDLAEAEKALDAVAADLKTLRAMVDGSSDLVRLIRSPVISRDDQSKAMGALLAKAGCGALTKKFIGLVARNRRLFALPGMIESFGRILADRRGELTAVVTAAAPLGARQTEALGASLEKAAGRKVAVDIKVDPAILGGLVVKIGSRMVDSSLKTKLQQLRLAMKGVG